MSEFKKGDRVRYSSAGLSALRFNKPNREGTVTSKGLIKGNYSDHYYVLWDETKTPSGINEKFIERALP